MTTTTSHSLSGRVLTLTVTLVEPSVALNSVAGSVDWGDGSATDIPRTTKLDNSATFTYTHTYAGTGFYVIRTAGRNFRSPEPDTDLSIIYLDLGSSPIIQINRGFLRGPLLPEDSSTSHWVFNSGSDIEVIASDLRNLLLTKQGERLMLPDFGTQIHRLVFEPDTSVLETQIQQEISQAVSKYEPRVSIISTSVDRIPNQRQVNVNVQVQALNQFLTVGLNFS